MREVPSVHVTGSVTDDHGGWAYTTFLADAGETFWPSFDGSTPEESAGWGWFTPEEMKALPLHPGLKAILPKLLASDANAGIINNMDTAEKQLRRQVGLDGQETWQDTEPQALPAAGGGAMSMPPVPGGVPGFTAGAEPPRWDGSSPTPRVLSVPDDADDGMYPDNGRVRSERPHAAFPSGPQGMDGYWPASQPQVQSPESSPGGKRGVPPSIVGASSERATESGKSLKANLEQVLGHEASQDGSFDSMVEPDLTKVGAEGYIHGWVCVRPPCGKVGDAVSHPVHGTGEITNAGENNKLHATFSDGSNGVLGTRDVYDTAGNRIGSVKQNTDGPGYTSYRTVNGVDDIKIDSRPAATADDAESYLKLKDRLKKLQQSPDVGAWFTGVGDYMDTGQLGKAADRLDRMADYAVSRGETDAANHARTIASDIRVNPPLLISYEEERISREAAERARLLAEPIGKPVEEFSSAAGITASDIRLENLIANPVGDLSSDEKAVFSSNAKTFIESHIAAKRLSSSMRSSTADLLAAAPDVSRTYGNLRLGDNIGLLDDGDIASGQKLADAEGRVVKRGQVGTPDGDDVIRRAAVMSLIGEWASSSNSSPISVAMQVIAKDEFGLDSKKLSRSPDLTDGDASVKAVVSQHGNVLRDLLRTQYNLTQQDFKDNGISSVTAYRGMSFSSLPKWARSETGPPKQRPLTSWSLDEYTASGFTGIGDARNGVILNARIPAQAILSYPGSGMGYAGMKELVVLGGKASGNIGVSIGNDQY